MSAKMLYRSAAGMFVLFAVGHTLGFLRFRPASPEALAVREAMMNVHFQVRHAAYTYGGFYTGFGLYVTVYLLFSAFLAWQLGTLTSSAPQVARSMGWALCAVQVLALLLSLVYFSAAPAVLSGVLAAMLGWAALKVKSAETVLCTA